MSYYKCPVLFFREQCDIVVYCRIEEDIDSYYMETSDSAITEQAIAIVIVFKSRRVDCKT